METFVLQDFRLALLLQTVVIFVFRAFDLSDFFKRAIFLRSEPLSRRLRVLLHTFLGVYLAVYLRRRNIQHIHVHHGFFSSWIAMVAARLMGIPFSMTLHGSDLLQRADYLDIKLKCCATCFTVSNFNRNFILSRYPQTDSEKVVLQRMGVPPRPIPQHRTIPVGPQFSMLCVGRLHSVKNHSFLLQACHTLKQRGLSFECLVAGDGPERHRLEQMVADLGLKPDVRLLGYRPRRMIDHHYAHADLVVLTSQSEGVPLVLMEAMAAGTLVLAPAITGIPELVINEQTGFLYTPGSLEDFTQQVERIAATGSMLHPLRRAAWMHVTEFFNLQSNLEAFIELLLSRIPISPEVPSRENSVLQQVQL